MKMVHFARNTLSQMDSIPFVALLYVWCTIYKIYLMPSTAVVVLVVISVGGVLLLLLLLLLLLISLLVLLIYNRIRVE